MSHSHKFRPETRHTPKVLDKVYLRVVWQREPIKIRALDGTRLISAFSKLFSAFIHQDFYYLNSPSEATPETAVKIFKNIADGTFLKIFKSLPGYWDDKWFNQDQIIAFCEDNKEWIGSEKAVICLCLIDPEKPVNESRPQDNLMVVSLLRDKDGLMVDKDALDRPTVWSQKSENFFIVPNWQ